MRLIGIFLTACVVLAAAQAIATVLIVLLLIAFLYSLATAPKETLGVAALLLALGAFQAYPLAFLGVITLIVLAAIVQRMAD